MKKNRSKALFFFAALLWGASYAFQKPLLEHISPVTFTFWNFFISGIVFLLYALLKKIPLGYRLKEGIILGFLLCGIEIMEMIGLQLTSSANAVFLTNFGMLLVPFVGFVLFRHTVKKEDMIALLIATVGMYMLVGGLDKFGNGEIFLLLSALSCAFYFLYTERFEAERSSHVTTLCIQQFFVITAVCFGISQFTGVTLAVPHALQETLLWQVALFTTIPYAVIQWASRYADEMVAAIYDGVVEPLVGSLMSWVVFAEVTSSTKVSGGLLMVFAFGLAAIFSNRHSVRSVIHGYFK